MKKVCILQSLKQPVHTFHNINYIRLQINSQYIKWNTKNIQIRQKTAGMRKQKKNYIMVNLKPNI